MCGHLVGHAVAVPLRSQIDAVLFDVGGVLLVPHPQFASVVPRSHGVDVPERAYIRSHFEGVRAMHEHGLDADHWPEYHRAYARYLVAASDRAGTFNDDELDALGASMHHAMSTRREEDRWWTYVLPGAVACLRELVDRGVPIGIVSNADGRVSHDLALAEVCQVGPGALVPMSVIVDSGEVGVAKPDPAIFEFALAALPHITRDRIAYIGDTVRNDVLGAEAAGLRPVQIDPYGLHADASHLRIQHLTDVLTWF
jgi:putative hydrolase of the HAD superfamily